MLWFGLLLLAIAVWCLFIGLEAAATTLHAKEIFSVLAYLGTPTTPLLFFLFAVHYTQQDDWLTRPIEALLWVLPVATIVIAATNTLHKWLWPTIKLTRTWAGVTGVYAHGPWYLVEVCYSYLLMIAACAGIPAGHLETIFQPFQKSEVTGGTGIGLAIVRKVAEAYGGSVRAYNEGGACFEFKMKDWPSEGDAG